MQGLSASLASALTLCGTTLNFSVVIWEMGGTDSGCLCLQNAKILCTLWLLAENPFLPRLFFLFPLKVKFT